MADFNPIRTDNLSYLDSSEGILMANCSNSEFNVCDILFANIAETKGNVNGISLLEGFLGYLSSDNENILSLNDDGILFVRGKDEDKYEINEEGYLVFLEDTEES
jgi:hypothetical protein